MDGRSPGLFWLFWLKVDSCDISKDTRNWHIGMKKIWRDHVNPEIFNKDSGDPPPDLTGFSRPFEPGPGQDEEQSRPIQELGRQIQARWIADAVAWRPVAVFFGSFLGGVLRWDRSIMTYYLTYYDIMISMGSGIHPLHSCPANWSLKCLAFGMSRHMGVTANGVQMGFDVFQPVLRGSSYSTCSTDTSTTHQRICSYGEVIRSKGPDLTPDLATSNFTIFT